MRILLINPKRVGRGQASVRYMNATPLGSNFYQQLQAEGRIFETDVTKFNGQYSTFHPKNMTSEELENGLRWIWNTFYSKASIKRRLARRLLGLPPGEDENDFPNTTKVLMGLNIAFKVAVEDF